MNLFLYPPIAVPNDDLLNFFKLWIFLFIAFWHKFLHNKFFAVEHVVKLFMRNPVWFAAGDGHTGKLVADDEKLTG
jgi:hypothetical protein